MPAPSAPARLGDAAGTLRLLAYLAAGVVLAVADHRGGWMHQLRQQVGIVAEPVRAVAGLPGRITDTTVDNVATVAQLAHRNDQLRRELLISQARVARLSTVIADNARLRALLDAAQRGGLDVQLAPILDVDLDPTHQRVVLDAGARDAVREGQSVIDAYGLLGQVTHVGTIHSDVLLITDPDHAVPVAVARNGVRLVAYGTGRSDLLSLANIPLSSDIKVGDTIVTSGLGGRFPPGFPVGRIIALRPDESRAFLEGDVRPAAQLDRGREVLLLRTNRISLPPPPLPPQAVTGVPGSVGIAGEEGVPVTQAPTATPANTATSNKTPAPASPQRAAASTTSKTPNAASSQPAAPPAAPSPTGTTPANPPSPSTPPEGR
ncbi:rod shape-determining protein MreC [Lysobacter sp. TY2-98]|uniref:rod shape-determining protein MreC n=1 Tax=Lysobacter sp. TY2-98 TaxID=2290922 RepID=UPI000E1FF5BD|nr:rod shape-determining protein MreC [Lysobacter sp. TY2-98]AXK73458.1 rod shape-determining protein MreC [Lysobacter sp. TY2-98]